MIIPHSGAISNKDISESKKQNEIIVFGILSLISEIMINQYYNKSKIEAYIKDIISISINILEMIKNFTFM